MTAQCSCLDPGHCFFPDTSSLLFAVHLHGHWPTGCLLNTLCSDIRHLLVSRLFRVRQQPHLPKGSFFSLLLPSDTVIPKPAPLLQPVGISPATIAVQVSWLRAEDKVQTEETDFLDFLLKKHKCGTCTGVPPSTSMNHYYMIFCDTLFRRVEQVLRYRQLLPGARRDNSYR